MNWLEKVDMDMFTGVASLTHMKTRQVDLNLFLALNELSRSKNFVVADAASVGSDAGSIRHDMPC